MKEYKTIMTSTCLILILWLSVAGVSSLPGAQYHTKTDSVKAELKRTITALEERVALNRSMGEFVEEIGLFDNRIYGRISQKGTRQADEVNTLNSRIETKNSELETTLDNLEHLRAMKQEYGGDYLGIEGEVPPYNILEYENMVERLEGEIADLQVELNSLLVPLEAGTELLDGSLMLNEVLPPVETLDAQSAELLLEQQRRLLEELEREEQKILGQQRPSQGSTPEEIKKKK